MTLNLIEISKTNINVYPPCHAPGFCLCSFCVLSTRVNAPKRKRKETHTNNTKQYFKYFKKRKCILSNILSSNEIAFYAIFISLFIFLRATQAN